MRDRLKKIIVGILLISVVLLLSCTPAQGPPPKTLNDMQIVACNDAHEVGSCDTRLPEVGIVLKEECCKNLGKCCV